jgi:hypothetical protein
LEKKDDHDHLIFAEERLKVAMDASSLAEPL